jgi:hypothetical protein
MTGIMAADVVGKGDYEPGWVFYGRRRPTLAHLILESDPETEKKYLSFTRLDEKLVAISHIPNLGGREVYLWGMAAPLKDTEGHITGAIQAVRDITEMKKLEEKLQQTLDDLEERVRERTAEIEEANTALRVLLKRREEDQVNLEERLQLNINELVAPLIETMKVRSAHDITRSHLDLLEARLNEIASPFLHTLLSVYRNLTPKEIRVASLIREGKNTKDMAELIGVSRLTIEKHRNNIRKKLGLIHGKTNLRSFLLAVK